MVDKTISKMPAATTPTPTTMPMIDGKDKSVAGRFGGAGIAVVLPLPIVTVGADDDDNIVVGGARLRVGTLFDPEGVNGGDVGILGVCVGATD
jgi:hypothetical protein